jgi:hypothetical protein
VAAASRTSRSFTGAIEEPSPVTSVVTPWRTLLAARLSTSTLNSDWPRRSMNPGATTRLVASIVLAALTEPSEPTAAMRSATIPTSPRNQGLPVPSTMRPLEMSRSKRVASG